MGKREATPRWLQDRLIARAAEKRERKGLSRLLAWVRGGILRIGQETPHA